MVGWIILILMGLISSYRNVPYNRRFFILNKYSTYSNLNSAKETTLYSSKSSITTDFIVLDQINLIVDIWGAVSQPDNKIAQSVEFRLSDYHLTRHQIRGLLQHFQTCKDCAGDGAFLMATQNDNNEDILHLSNVKYSILTDDGADEEWGNFDPQLLGQEETGTLPIFPIESNDSLILKDSQEWVKRVIADFSICPFTMDPIRAGIPLGGVRYSVSRATTPEEAFYRYWQEVQLLLATSEKVMSTILLIFPELELFGNYELFEAYCESLNDALSCSSLNAEKEIQLVFFHPRFQFRDGQARSGSQHGAPNYARRSPWPMINILRTSQVRAAQKGVPTGIVYKNNEEKLTAIGSDRLQEMLCERDWSQLPSHVSMAKSNKYLEQLMSGSLDDPNSNQHHSILISTSSQKTYPVENLFASSSNKQGGCPIDHKSLANQATSPSITPDPVTAAPSPDKDYLALADLVDDWLTTMDDNPDN